MGALFTEMVFAADLSEFTSETDTEGDFIWNGTTNASPDGGTGCAQAIIDNTTAALGTKDIGAALGTTPTDVQAYFALDLGDLAIATDTESVILFAIRTASANIAYLRAVKVSGVLKLNVAIDADSVGTGTANLDVALTQVPQYIAVWLTKASTTTSNDGRCRWYFKGGGYVNAWTEVADFTGVDLHAYIEALRYFRAGAATVGASVTASGVLFDRINAHDDTALLVFNAVPTVSDPGTLYAGHEAYPVGTAVTVADTDSDLDSIVCACASGKGTWTATAAGDAVVTGAGTATLTIDTGTHANILTTFATVTLTPTTSAASIVTNACTITATDDVEASAARNFNVVQSYGVIRGTLAQVQATLAGVLEVENATEQSCIMGVTATDSNSDVGYAECALNFSEELSVGGVGLRSGISAILAKQRTRDRRRGLVRMRP